MRNRKNYRPMAKYISAAAVPVFLLVVFYVLALNTDAMTAVSRHFSNPALRAMGKFFSGSTLSFLEIFVGIAIAACIIFITLFIVKLIKGRGHRVSTFFKFILALISILAIVWNGYCWLWNSGYYTESFGEKSGLETAGTSKKDLYAATEFFAQKLNELSGSVSRDENGLFNVPYEDYAEEYGSLYDSIDEEFPFLSGDTLKPKTVHFSKIMSLTGFTGIFFPFSGETYINVHQPAAFIPNTIAHEIAHQRGVHLEAECNFLGIAACIQSDNPAYVYSGYLSGYIHLSNALYSADPEGWREIRASLNSEVSADLDYNNAYWQEMEGVVSKATDTVYDAFLKVNTQEIGIKSYGQCVDLLVSWLNKSEFSPYISA